MKPNISGFPHENPNTQKMIPFRLIDLIDHLFHGKWYFASDFDWRGHGFIGASLDWYDGYIVDVNVWRFEICIYH